MSDTYVIYPKIIDELLDNPGIGFIAAPGLMEPAGSIHDNRGNPVEKYKFTDSSRTSNHPDSRITYCGVRWRDLEAEKGRYRWDILEKKLEEAKALGCTAIVRCSPYALAEEDDIPDWFRRECQEEPEFPFWRVDPLHSPYVSYWSEFIAEFAEHFDGHPVISSVDMALVGAWGEGGGTEFLDEECIRQMVGAYVDNFKITPLQALLHDPKSVKIIRERKENIGFRVDCLGDMGGFHQEEWSHMLDFYPENICNFEMEDAWKKAPVVFEACWHMNDWYLQGWDIDYIVDESLKWHISSFNSKGTTVPEAWKESVKRWLNKMGYRFELRKLTYHPVVKKGEGFRIRGLWANTGVAPIYHKYPLVVRLKNEKEVISLTSKADIRNWLPDMDILWEEEFALEGMAGEYSLEIGIETGIPELGNIKLAIEGLKDGYYCFGKIIVE
ncbi:DUF4832 domain-containing protein [Lacrimispora sphenoides]|uniref:DUF4832 domain-containing protein n=1 Tax=Lacrimispora sphenoides JCM 1415 TaxID=1297793 RepID=A0ABY1C419_9FIRM|nr:DUF4832 domain-containing protein [Lacrimispora sphenoides]SET63021.1 protein of unknown function [[Clostridium] sphenoides JCM 1415]SUY50157.1 Uncharacterised protein [Lacrimispora sphenoides]